MSLFTVKLLIYLGLGIITSIIWVLCFITEDGEIIEDKETKKVATRTLIPLILIWPLVLIIFIYIYGWN